MTKEVNVKNVARWYMMGIWTPAMVEEALVKGKISVQDRDKILKLPVKG